MPGPGPGPAPHHPSWKVPHPAGRERLNAKLAEMLAPVVAEGFHVECAVREGNAVREILDEARSLPADMVVMGTHGRGGFAHFFLGSVTEKVMRNAPCPVLTVPPLAEGSSPRGSPLCGRILCPLDFSGPSDHALRYALSIAQESRSEIVLLHVLESSLAEHAGGELAWVDVPEYRLRMETDARQRLQEAVPEEARDWCQAHEELAVGKAWREILRTAEERRSDLIVMGVRGRNAVDLAVFGSTTHHVVRRAHCPVLVIHTD